MLSKLFTHNLREVIRWNRKMIKDPPSMASFCICCYFCCGVVLLLVESQGNSKSVHWLVLCCSRAQCVAVWTTTVLQKVRWGTWRQWRCTTQHPCGAAVRDSGEGGKCIDKAFASSRRHSQRAARPTAPPSERLEQHHTTTRFWPAHDFLSANSFCPNGQIQM